MTNDETRMTKEVASCATFCHSGFVIDSSFGFRASLFSMEVPRPQLVPLQQVAAVEQAFGQDVDDLALALDVAVALEQGRVAGGGVVLVVNLRPEDQVGDAGLVFEGDEHHA